MKNGSYALHHIMRLELSVLETKMFFYYWWAMRETLKHHIGPTKEIFGLKV